MIECDGLVKRFGAAAAVDGVSINIDGGICALLGPNGAGKSTLLSMMTGLIAPDAGDVQVGGMRVAAQPQQVKRLMGVLPEELGLFNALTVREHLEMIGPVYGLSAVQVAERADGLLRVLRMERAGRTRARDCSYGMRKKTALAMALLHDPRFLILDEPFEGIDPASSYAFQRVLEDAARRGVTVVFTSHLLPLVERLATRVVVLNRGRVALDSATSDLRGSLEEEYFEVVAVPKYEELAWQGS